MKTVLIYCQYLVGVGHLIRSLSLCRELLAEARVVLLQGGPDIDRTIDHPRFTHLQLTPLLGEVSSDQLRSPDGLGLDAVWAARRTEIDAALEQPVDLVITEYFPFSRRPFTAEIEHLLVAARSRHGAPALCSLRDLPNPQIALPTAERDRLLGEYFRAVLWHGDASVGIPCPDGLPAAVELVPTGYVAPPKLTSVPANNGTIVVSIGGGRFGTLLFDRVLAVAHRFADRRFILYASPFASGYLEENGTLPDNVEARPFSADFEQQLAGAELSLSLFGYNTAVSIARYGVNALVYPYERFVEQVSRAQAFERKGLVRCLHRSELDDPELLFGRIEQALAEPLVAAGSLDLNGAGRARQYVARLFAS